MTKPHPQALILIALAEGKTVQYMSNGIWFTYALDSPTKLSPLTTTAVPWRVAPAIITIGSSTLNAPLRTKPADGTRYFVPDLTFDELVESYHWSGTDGDKTDNRFLSQGLCFAYQGDAAGAAKAFLALLAP